MDDVFCLGFDNFRGRNFSAVDEAQKHPKHVRLNISNWDGGVGVAVLGQARKCWAASSEDRAMSVQLFLTVARRHLKGNIRIEGISGIKKCKHIRRERVGRRPSRWFVKRNLDVDFDCEISIWKIVLGSVENALSFGIVTVPQTRRKDSKCLTSYCPARRWNSDFILGLDIICICARLAPQINRDKFILLTRYPITSGIHPNLPLQSVTFKDRRRCAVSSLGRQFRKIVEHRANGFPLGRNLLPTTDVVLIDDFISAGHLG
mmetsp:Transcript_26398/g.61756  ORF Transcript_26398/g.61756 Transcript_26398/m.61756 type:complete len:261 (-) Transcript_26398:106-888(-)